MDDWLRRGWLTKQRRGLFDFMETRGEKRAVSRRRIAPEESFVEKNTPEPKAPP